MLMLLFVIKCKLAQATTLDIAIKFTNNCNENNTTITISFVVFNPAINELSILLTIALLLSWNIIVIRIISNQQLYERLDYKKLL